MKSESGRGGSACDVNRLIGVRRVAVTMIARRYDDRDEMGDGEGRWECDVPNADTTGAQMRKRATKESEVSSSLLSPTVIFQERRSPFQPADPSLPTRGPNCYQVSYTILQPYPPT